ncbi:MAG: hypothetical protein Q9162_002056 [Coniocarpon cinnabarinum]
MQPNGRNPLHNYTTSGSSAGSYRYGHERMNSHSRSDSYSSRTQYEDFTNVPSPKVMTDYGRNSLRYEFEQNAHRQDRAHTASIDRVTLHLLVETAVNESIGYNVMTLQEVEELKKEEAQLSRQVPALRRELVLEIRYRDAARGVNHVSARNDTMQGSARMSQDEYAASVQKCEALSEALYRNERRLFDVREQRLRHTAGVFQLDHDSRSKQDELDQVNGYEDSDEWDNGFSLSRFAPGGLADTEDGIMDIPSGKNAHVDATLQDLWSVLNSNNELLGSGTRGEEMIEEEFSIESFSEKVQILCSRAAELSYDLDSEREARKVTETAQQENRAELMQQLQTAKEKHQGRASDLEQAKMDAEAKHSEIEADMIRLQTDLTVAKAELEGAYGNRAQRQAEQAAGEQEIAQAQARVGTLQKELHEMVTEHETLTQQGIEAEKERETMERTIDHMREKLEALEVKLQEERVYRMGRNSGPASSASTPASAAAPKVVNAEDATSLRVMRSEFKKMMRDARAEHFRSLKVRTA